MGHLVETTELIRCIAKAPKQYLSQKSLQALEAFLLGVDTCLRAYGFRGLQDPLDTQFVWKWVLNHLEMTHEHAGRLNALNCITLYSFSEFLADGEEEAFEYYVALREKAALACPNPAQITYQQHDHEQAFDFFQFINDVTQRPALYLSHSWNVIALDNCARGYIYGEKEFLGRKSALDRLFVKFKCWLDQRYPYGHDRPWGNVIAFTCRGHRLTDIEFFKEHLDMFLSNESPNEQDRTHAQMIQNMLAHAKKNGDTEKL